MNVVIIEDEILAARRLQRMLEALDPGINVVSILDSIEDAVDWFNLHAQPDLVLMDIMLADGQSFEIFEQTAVKAPVIFTTAYDEFAIRAFKVNSIDYLLKPVEPALLAAALHKLRTVKLPEENLKKALETLINAKPALPDTYKSRFLVRSGDKFIPVPANEIAYFSFSDKLTFLTTFALKRFMLDHTLDELEKLVDPSQFFRLNRQYIAAFFSIKVVHNYFNGKLKVMVDPEIPEGIIVSKERAQSFKAWLSR